MRINTLKFGNPRNKTPQGLDGIIINFPFTVTVPAQGALLDKVTQHSITVEISDNLLCTWDIGLRQVRINEITKHMFEFARNEVINRLIDSSLKGHHSIDIDIDEDIDKPEHNPFDPTKLVDPNGATYTVEVQEKGNGKIGF